MASFSTTSNYWDCECKENFIHPRSQSKCSVCGTEEESCEAPDSRVNEVRQLIGNVDMGNTEFHYDPDDPKEGNKMTVKKLIKQLQEIENKVRVVIMSKDAEGNGYSPLSNLQESAYEADSTWSGEILMEGKLTPELIKQGYSEGDMENDNSQAAIILWPTN